MKANPEGGGSSLCHNNASIVFLSHMRLDGVEKERRENQGRPIRVIDFHRVRSLCFPWKKMNAHCIEVFA